MHRSAAALWLCVALSVAGTVESADSSPAHGRPEPRLHHKDNNPATLAQQAYDGPGSAPRDLQGGKLEYNPVANPDAVVLDPSGKARFTVLTSRLVRMEFSASGHFEDRASITFVNRNLEPPTVSVTSADGILRIETEHLALKYSSGEPFSKETLAVAGAGLAAGIQGGTLSTGAWRWDPSLPTTGNLLGTYSSLDQIGEAKSPPLRRVPLNCTDIAAQGISVEGESLHCAFGVVSRTGWALVNDTDSPTIGPDRWWTGERVASDEDLYIFGHGHDFKAAIQDFTSVAGRVPMLPRYMLGVMWSRWFNFDVASLHRAVDSFEAHGLPLDVLILDMNFHQKPGWTGYSFDRALFPHPAFDMAGFKERGLALAVNTHDRDGVGPEEDMFAELSRRLIGGKGGGTGEAIRVPFSICNSSEVTFAIEDTVVKHLQDQGVDFTWIDWQQGGTEGGCAGDAQNPRIWLNHVRSGNHARRGEPERGAVLARWGGLGSHRYPVGFSGDVAGIDSWDNLAFQQYFSMTAANVAYSWSHDIVGPGRNPEITVRWVQAGAYSSSFRIHDRGLSAGICAKVFPPPLQTSCGVVNMWELPAEHLAPVRDAMQERLRMVPYLYTAMRETWETGLQALRPMYYEWPAQEMAYASSSYEGCQGRGLCQFMLGPDMLVSPVLNPVSENTGLAEQSVWLPQGPWVEKRSGMLFRIRRPEGEVVRRSYSVSEVPVFVRGGSVVPGLPVGVGEPLLGVAQKAFRALTLTVYPGTKKGSCKVYEDDGATTAYTQKGAERWTTARYSRNTSALELELLQEGMDIKPSRRTFVIDVLNSHPPTAVLADGKQVKQAPTGRSAASAAAAGRSSWHYDGSAAAVRIYLGHVPSKMPRVHVEVHGDTLDADGQLSGVSGLVKRAGVAKDSLDLSRATPGSDQQKGGPAMLSTLASFGDHLSFLAAKDPASFPSALQHLKEVVLPSAQADVASIVGDNPRRLEFCKALIDTALCPSGTVALPFVGRAACGRGQNKLQLEAPGHRSASVQYV